MPSLNLEQQRKRAKDLRRAHQQGSIEAAVRIGGHLPRARELAPDRILAAPFTLSEAQFIIAREAGFPSWPALKHSVEAAPGNVELLLDAAIEGRDDVVASAPALHLACALADAEAVFAALDADPSAATRPGGQRAWQPLLYTCFARYHREESGPARAAIARRLIALGAPVTGREPNFRAEHGAAMSQDNDLLAIEAAAGRAASPELVAALLDSGADLAKTNVVLLQAVRGGNPAVLNILLDALPSEVAWQANWAIEEAVKLDRKDLLRILAPRVDLPAGRALGDAIRLYRDRETLELLLGGAGPSGRTIRRAQKAYRDAVRYGNVLAVEVLTKWGADASAVTGVDRILGACLAGEAAGALSGLRDADHQLLSWAIRTGRTQAVARLIEAGLNPAVADVDGETPLHLAVRAVDLALIDTLLAHGARIDEPDFDGRTPLEIALALPGGERIAKHLLDRGASAVACADPEVFERAADAVVAGDLATLTEMLDDEPALVRARSPRLHRATLLHYCSANGVEAWRQRTPPNAPAIAQLLIDRGARVNVSCNLYRGGATPLALVLSSHHPVRAGVRIALAEVLLAAETLDLPKAAALSRLEDVKRLLNQSQLQSAFFCACDFGRTAIAEYLIDRGADLSAQDNDGQTGLHLATLAGHLDTVKLLADGGAPLEIENNWGGSVLNHALYAAINHDPNVDYTPIVEILLDAGARVDSTWVDWWRGETPLRPESKAPIEALLERVIKS